MDTFFFASCPKHLEDLLHDEITALGGEQADIRPAGVRFTGSMETAGTLCLWSRIASRVFLEAASTPSADADDVYAAAREISWKDYLDPGSSFSVSASVAGRRFPDSPDYTALKAKDGIADYFREASGLRPSVDPRSPDIHIHIHIAAGRAVFSLELSGGPLHRRGYRTSGGDAPLKENIAAAMLYRDHWNTFAGQGRPLVDPMCGSGTILIEAAMIAGDVAPGLLRGREVFTASGLLGQALRDSLLDDARQRKAAGAGGIPPLFGYDIHGGALAAAKTNITAAGFAGNITLQRCSIVELKNPMPESPGLLITNPPYGMRIGSAAGDELPVVIGDVLRRSFRGWNAAILSPDGNFEKTAGLKAHRRNTLYNGTIRCTLYHLEVFSPDKRRELKEKAEEPVSPGAEMFARRLRKNMKQLKTWLRQEQVHCYRLYDADMPEYAVAVDVYEDVFGKGRAHVQEYAAPPTIDKAAASGRLKDACMIIRRELGLEREDLILKVRRRQKGSSQYEKMAETAERYEIEEEGLRFLINLKDYLDTGIFLDHRTTRSLIRRISPGKRFLNLFAYTGTATVYAAAGGARETTSVDTSRTYLDWTGDNLLANGIRGRQHRFVRQDSFEFLRTDRRRYDLVFIDPPTFSNSSDRRGTFDIQRDHAPLISLAASRLSAGGHIIFSTNAATFSLDTEGLAGLNCLEITAVTRPKDFNRPKPPHRCWVLSPVGTMDRWKTEPRTFEDLLQLF